MTSLALSLCQACERWEFKDPMGVYATDSGFAHGDGSSTCAAFPDGIPTWIALGGDHRRSVDGDEGIVFQLSRGRDLVYRAWLRKAGADDDPQVWIDAGLSPPQGCS